jgi:hypothetical protein
MKIVDLSQIAKIIYDITLESQKNRFFGLTKKEISAICFSGDPEKGLKD